jgi:hypothetical protein
MTQTMYAHENKWIIKNKRKKIKSRWILVDVDSSSEDKYVFYSLS